MKTIILIVIAFSLIACGCITFTETPEPEIVYFTPPIEYPTAIQYAEATIITTAAPGSSVILWKDCNGTMAMYDSVIVSYNGEAELIAPLQGTYILVTSISEHIVEVEEYDIIYRNTITV